MKIPIGMPRLKFARYLRDKEKHDKFCDGEGYIETYSEFSREPIKVERCRYCLAVQRAKQREREKKQVQGKG